LKPPPSKNVLKLVAMLKDKFDLDAIPESFCRTYAGHHQRSSGAWSWSIDLAVGDIGCSWSLKETLKSKNLEIITDFGNTELIPND